MRGLFAIAVLMPLAGCGAVDAVGAAARVVATGVEVAGSVAGATVGVVGSAASGAVDLATGGGGEASPASTSTDAKDPRQTAGTPAVQTPATGAD